MNTNKLKETGRRAFTRLDLLVATVAILFLMLMHGSSVADGRGGSRDLQCVANLRNFAAGLLMYCGDNQSKFPAAGRWGNALVESGQRPPEWVANNWLDMPTSNRNNVDPYAADGSIAGSVLWAYVGESPSVWRCPSDPSTGSHPDYLDGAEVPRVRSYSMNGWVGGNPWGGSFDYAVMFELGDVYNPGAENTFSFICERADSINDGYFIVEMTGFNPDHSEPGRTTKIVDFPSFYHDRGFNLSFIDGHVENYRMKDPRTMPSYNHGQEMQLNVQSPDNRDVRWLQERATRIRQ